MRDRGPQLKAQPKARQYQVLAPDRAHAVVAARDRAWDEGLQVVGDATVALIRSRSHAHEFLVTLACLTTDAGA